MKTRFLSLALAFVFAFVPTVTPPATAAVPADGIIKDANFYTAMLTLLGKPDGYVITAADVSGIAILDVNTCGISDLTGIEYFTALEELDCRYNKLTTLNISKNTQLEHLFCMSNQLTALDLSQNTALGRLDCQSNKLTALDVSKNTLLIALYCGNNPLGTLDVSHNTELTGLICQNNNLAALDVSKNTALSRLYCSDNQLTTLDLSKNTAMKWLICDKNYFSSKAAIIGLNESLLLEFEFDPQKTGTPPSAAVPAGSIIKDPAFYAKVLTLIGKTSGYAITAEDVSGITSLSVNSCDISDLTGIEYFTKLESLQCYSNLLTVLNVSKNTALTTLFCADNQLTALDVSKNTNLVNLSCEYNQLTALDVSKNTALAELYCGFNKLTTLDMSKNTALTRLHCGYNFLTALDVSKNTALIYLYCNDNKLPSLNVSGNTKLECLDCEYNKLTALDTSKNTALRLLFCAENQLTSLDVSKNTKLESLRCYENLLPGESAITGLNKSQLSFFMFDPQNVPDPWAASTVNTAMSLGLVPQELQSKYSDIITRAEYCALTVALYEKLTGAPITARRTFSDDGGDVNIQKLGGLGIVNGNTDGTFSPYGVFTREMVAALTVNFVKTLTGQPLPESASTFSDNAQASGWALEHIGKVQKAGLMNGGGNNNFEPQKAIDRQSAIALSMNLYNKYK